MIDVIIPARSNTESLHSLTQETILSLHISEPKANFNVIVVESGGVDQNYQGAKTILYPEGERFNYNKALNIGMQFTENEYIIFCNNDLIFQNHFFLELKHAFNYGFQSVCPICPRHHKLIPKEYEFISGYNVGGELIGWCIAVKRSIFDKIGKFDESVDFWYSDHVYAEQLKEHQIPHALVTASKVLHLGSQTLNSLTPEEYLEVTILQKKKYQDYLKLNNKEPQRLHLGTFTIGK